MLEVRQRSKVLDCSHCARFTQAFLWFWGEQPTPLFLRLTVPALRLLLLASVMGHALARGMEAPAPAPEAGAMASR